MVLSNASQVWKDGLDSVRELLYPKWCFDKDIVEE